MAFRVTGEEQLDRVARSLAGHVASKSITRRLRSTIRDEAGVITRHQRDALASGLPKRGGAAVTISSEARLSVRTGLSTSRSAAVDIVDSWKGHDMKAIDRGSLRHPLYGNRAHWYNTAISAGLLTKPVVRHSVPIRRAIGRQLDLLAEEIARET